ncbi:MAG: hypothetical protein KDK75_22390, partial [Alphaproteobacteria bacterium]|nr:hypothetical protein [Alphaproteobacteria bacterium]
MKRKPQGGLANSPGACVRALTALRGDLLSGGTLQHTVPLQHQASPWAFGNRPSQGFRRTPASGQRLTTGKSAPLLPSSEMTAIDQTGVC